MHLRKIAGFTAQFNVARSRTDKVASCVVLYPSSFKLQGCWLQMLIPVTYSSKLQGILVLAAYLQLEC